MIKQKNNMKILGIETSCDETAISVIEIIEKKTDEFEIIVLANELLSQIDIHKKYGGVFPTLAKREHAKNLPPLLTKALLKAKKTESEFCGYTKKNTVSEIPFDNSEIESLLSREPGMFSALKKEIAKIEKPALDAIVVTRGPGLEPALWTGINFAKAISTIWKIPLLAVNHMEGHIFVSLLKKRNFAEQNIKNKGEGPEIFDLKIPSLPIVSLLVSGGHTELILSNEVFHYQILGKTRDDAAGEAFDKVARIIGLPYPGGPEISKLAEKWRASGKKGLGIVFPQPMVNSKNFDFSFSGLKTSVLYFFKKLKNPGEEEKMEIAAAFEDATTDVLISKTKKAVKEKGARAIIVGGGVVANKILRQKLMFLSEKQKIPLFIPEIPHSTDNALMIAIAGGIRLIRFGNAVHDENFGAEGNLKMA